MCWQITRYDRKMLYKFLYKYSTTTWEPVLIARSTSNRLKSNYHLFKYPTHQEYSTLERDTYWDRNIVWETEVKYVYVYYTFISHLFPCRNIEGVKVKHINKIGQLLCESRFQRKNGQKIINYRKWFIIFISLEFKYMPTLYVNWKFLECYAKFSLVHYIYT